MIGVAPAADIGGMSRVTFGSSAVATGGRFAGSKTIRSSADRNSVLPNPRLKGLVMSVRLFPSSLGATSTSARSPGPRTIVQLLQGILHVPAIDADQLERLAVAEHQLEVAALRRVDDAPPLQSAVAHGQRRADPAIDEHVVAFAAEQRAEDAAAVGRVQRPVIVESRCR